MPGPKYFDPSRPARREPEFGTASQADLPAFLGIMRIVHEPPMAGSFGRLLTDEPLPGDLVPLAHLFEEVSTLAVHRLISEDLLFDAFAIDLYWEQLKATIQGVRESSSNPKFCENFENCADLARTYRELRPAKSPDRPR
ncbi:MAG: hypothetical protein JF888_09965 [Candidatus Dormibacteraeota bacterium]|uniref:Uncharacterized protein n=1 Tax=Candidatus Dormiibacter inghamiae TaxID=3127013 RepID=A0A934KH99_9BACT|nr:hypothetical protein [Candidatus Dormibacteraeota bacterium]MBJ7607537.1 hypothetical protein [Candidatus Dormibacteraeota bacterium]